MIDALSAPATDAFAALRIPAVRRFAVGRAASTASMHIVMTTVGWQLYERTRDAWALGLVGLCLLLPVLVLAIPAGQLADRFRRRDLAMVACALLAAATLGQAAIAWLRAPVVFIYAALLLAGVARAFASASVGAILPQLLPPAQFLNANAWLASSFQLAATGGPAIAGFLIAATGSATLSYLVASAGYLTFFGCLATLPAPPPPSRPPSRRAADLLAGFGFIGRNPVFLAAITLDLFAVLLGGAVALLPMFAKEILKTGPVSLGGLRSAAPAGALFMALLSTRLPAWQRPGRILLLSVAGFGLATIGFGLSRNLGVCLLCLFFTGVFDEISVIIRVTLAQVITPDPLRGRVSAAHALFINSADELGFFESGATAAAWGPVASIVGGGLGTLGVACAVALLCPALVRLGPFHTLRPAGAAPDGLR